MQMQGLRGAGKPEDGRRLLSGACQVACSRARPRSLPRPWWRLWLSQSLGTEKLSSKSFIDSAEIKPTRSFSAWLGWACTQDPLTLLPSL